MVVVVVVVAARFGGDFFFVCEPKLDLGVVLLGIGICVPIFRHFHTYTSYPGLGVSLRTYKETPYKGREQNCHLNFLKLKRLIY